MRKLDISEIDGNLLGDLAGNADGWQLFEAPYEGATVQNQHYQIVFHEEAGRAGIVFCGSGSSGATSWTDARTPEEAFERFLAHDMRN